MQSKLYIIGVILALYNFIGDSYAQDLNHGILQTHIYHTSVNGNGSKKVKVYLPKNYYTDNKAYPVVYFLHGANGNEKSWMEKGHILKNIDSLVSHGIIEEYIYVFPNTNRYNHKYDYLLSRPKGSIESYLDLNGSVEYSFIEELITYVDMTFKTIPMKHFRAIAGLSLGGLQSLYITANSVDTFGYIGLFSPLIYPPLTLGMYSNIYRNLESKLKSQFADPTLKYMIMIGEDDPYYKSAYIFSELLKRNNYNFQFIPTTGGHSWDNWESYSIIFMESLWDKLPEKTQ